MRTDSLVAVDFTEDFKAPKRNEIIKFTAKSFQAWVSRVLPASDKIKATNLKDLSNSVVVGKFKFYMAKMPVTYSSSLFPGGKPRQQTSTLCLGNGSDCCFDGVVSIPILAGSTGNPWMSLVPMEVLTLRKLIRYAKGNVGIAGMGLGYLATRVIESPRVTELTVYERDPAVLSFFGESVVKRGQELGKSVTLVEADAYKVDWHVHDQALWDIWEGGSDSSDDWQFWIIAEELREAGKSCHGWRTVKPSDYCRRQMAKARKKESVKS
jgi:hypothetical protein